MQNNNFVQVHAKSDTVRRILFHRTFSFSFLSILPEFLHQFRENLPTFPVLYPCHSTKSVLKYPCKIVHQVERFEQLSQATAQFFCAFYTANAVCTPDVPGRPYTKHNPFRSDRPAAANHSIIGQPMVLIFSQVKTTFKTIFLPLKLRLRVISGSTRKRYTGLMSYL